MFFLRRLKGGEYFRTKNEGAPYLARFWRDVGINGCWQNSASCAENLRFESSRAQRIDDRSLRLQKV
jgi:hypothetical protein